MQRLLPPFVFPDGAPSAFFHTAEMDSYAKVMRHAYKNQSAIYANFFPQTCDENTINLYELKYFGKLGSSSLTLAQRQALVIQKIQSARGITKQIIRNVVNYTIPGLSFEIAVWIFGQGEGGWVLDVSQLDIETYLNTDAQYALPVGPQLCSQGPADWGMTPQQWADLQTYAYTYEVRIYGYTLTPQQYSELDAALSANEPARSTHVINSGLPFSEMLNPAEPITTETGEPITTEDGEDLVIES